jgi:hypothetical protein
MARKTRKTRGGVSLFGKKRPTRRSSSIKRSVQKRKEKLEKINKDKQINKLKQGKCLAQYQRCMGVSRRRSH